MNSEATGKLNTDMTVFTSNGFTSEAPLLHVWTVKLKARLYTDLVADKPVLTKAKVKFNPTEYLQSEPP